MTEPIGGVVPLGSMLAGIKSDVLGEHDTSGTTTFHLAIDSDKHARLLDFVTCRLEARARANHS